MDKHLKMGLLADIMFEKLDLERTICSKKGPKKCWTPPPPRHPLQSPGQTERHCLANISNFVCEAYLCVWPPRRALLDKHVFLFNFKSTFCLPQAENVYQAHICIMADKHCN